VDTISQAPNSPPQGCGELVVSVRISHGKTGHPLEVWRARDRYYVRDVNHEFGAGAWIAGPYRNLEDAGAALFRLATVLVTP
jgi:hypothetical protein